MLLELLKKRHSIRKYTEEQISCEELKSVMEAGSYAPNAGGGQRSMLVGIRNKELVAKIGIMNLALFDRSRLAGSFVSKEQPSNIDDPSIRNGFYGAPAVVIVFAQNDFLFRTADAYCCAENMLLMATELGLASCIVSRGEETFCSEAGKKLLREWQVPDNYSAVCFVILGHLAGDEPHGKPRHEGRIKIIG